VIEGLENTLKKAKKIVFLTGAGISQESGISTFRGKDGLWQKYDPMKLASAQAFRIISSTIRTLVVMLIADFQQYTKNRPKQ
jgi:NAD-dependent SIR2 family protein deacetylase